MGQVLNLMAFVVFATTLFMRSVDPVIPQIAEGLNVTTTTAAMLSTGFTLPYALIQPVLGALADMFSKTRLIAPSACLLSALPRLRAVSRRTSKRSWHCVSLRELPREASFQLPWLLPATAFRCSSGKSPLAACSLLP
jgi:MFS family permease